ncbi:MAG: hypothetical protein AAFP09_02760, partial [Cyanobacteria bacterium J06607_10]
YRYFSLYFSLLENATKVEAMEYLSKKDLLNGLPLILAGPILRRTEPDAVTVWIALKAPCRVDLSVFETADGGRKLQQCIFASSRMTTAIGQHLHVVAVTARAMKGDVLLCDRIYAYDLCFHTGTPNHQKISLTAALNQEKNSTQQISEGHAQKKFDTTSISYFDHQKPTFSLPPQQLSDLKIVHGSCRKPHGRGYDALSLLDGLLAADADTPHNRPHQLFLTGDQIYGDDVSDPLLWLATPLGDAILGWEEELPLSADPNIADANITDASITDASIFSSQASPNKSQLKKVRPKKLAAGNRAHIATKEAGLTAGLTGKEERTTSHLFSFGEYCAVYLLAYSPACWPAALPVGRDVTTGRKKIRQWNKDKRNMEQFVYSLWKVRRVLANIPTYTIFDDHDVSDDWNLNQAWCLQILGQPLGRRTVQNAMLAYAIFQAWGNTPEQFEENNRENGAGAELLRLAQQWSRSAGKDTVAQARITRLLGLPSTDPHTDLPNFVEDKDVWVFQRSKVSITWHYTIRSACHEVLVLDTRTWRGYPMDDDAIAPPMLLSPTAFAQQLIAPFLEKPVSSFATPNVEASTSSSQQAYGTFVIAPTNVFGMRVLDWIQQWHLDRKKVFTADVGDSWNFHERALATLLTTLFQHREKVVVLSGDIHYSSAIHVAYQECKTGEQKELVQLTSSAMKNEELLTQVLHTRLKHWLLAERPRHWIGWHSPADMAEISPRRKQSRLDIAERQPAPDWQCRMRWLPRQRANTVQKKGLSALMPPRTLKEKSLLEWLTFWKSRWFQEGKEVIGINNIALVKIKIEPVKNMTAGEPSSGSKLLVKQDHYYFSPWKPVQVVCSQFSSEASP